MPWPLRSCWVNSHSVLHMERHLLSVSIHAFPGRFLEYCSSCESGQLKYNMRKVLLCWLHCKQLSKQYFYKYFICIDTAQGQQHREHLLWSCSATEIWSDSKFWKEDNDCHGRGWGACVLFLDEKIVCSWVKAITGVSVQVNRETIVSAFLNGNFKRCLLLQISFLHLHVHLTRTHHLARAFL